MLKNNTHLPIKDHCSHLVKLIALKKFPSVEEFRNVSLSRRKGYGAGAGEDCLVPG